MIGLLLARAGLARADEVPPYEPVRKPPPPPPIEIPEPPPPAPPPPAPPPLHSIELAIAFPPASRVTGAPFDTRGQSFSLDAIGRLDVGHGVDVGVALGIVDWRNYQTSYLGGMNHVVDVRLLARRSFGDGAFRPFLQASVGAGLSVIAPEFTIYDNIRGGSHAGSTAVGDRVGVAYLADVAIGFRRALDERWTIVGEVALRAATMRHHVVFTDSVGTVASTDGLGLREIDARVAIVYAF